MSSHVLNSLGALALSAFAFGCVSPEPDPSYPLGGSVTGLTGELSLTNSETNEALVVTGSSFSFTAQSSSTPYEIIITAQPAGQTCEITNGSGVVQEAAIENISVSCFTNWAGTQQFGSEYSDDVYSMDVAYDRSSVAVGRSYNIDNKRNEGAIWKRDVSGAQVWSSFDNQYGGVLRDVTLDGSGNIYAIGELDNRANGTSRDAYVVKLNAHGVIEWTQILGGDGSDHGLGIILASDGQLYITGSTSSTSFEDQPRLSNFNVFISQISTEGVKGWTKLIGGVVSENSKGGLAESPEGSLVLVYNTYSGIGITKLNKSGTLIAGWPKVVIQGDTSEHSYGNIAIDQQGGIYFAGRSFSAELFGEKSINYSVDFFIAKVSGSNGSLLWGHLIGSLGDDSAYAGVALDSQGNVITAGRTNGVLAGQLSAGGFDGFAAKHTSDGTLIWFKQFGSVKNEFTNAIGIDVQDNVLLTGATYGDLDGNENLGSSDAFLVKLAADTGELMQAAEL